MRRKTAIIVAMAAIVFVTAIYIFFITFIPMGDGLLLVKGSVVDANGGPIERCKLELYSAADDSQTDNSEIGSIFTVGFTINPRTQKYFFIINCPDNRLYHKTMIYKIDGLDYAEEPLDLGTIILKR